MKVSLKYQNTLKEICLEDSHNYDDFANILFVETEIAAPQQRIIVSGTILNKDNWRKHLKEGSKVMLLGCKAEQVKKLNIAGKEEPEKDVLEVSKKLQTFTPTGLRNFGATCYMNSGLQCLFSLPEFRNGLITFIKNMGKTDSLTSTNEKMVLALSNLFTSMMNYSNPDKNLIQFYDAACLVYPEYSTSTHAIGQQDAHEFTLRMIEQVTSIVKTNFTAHSDSTQSLAALGVTNFSRYIFGLNLIKKTVTSSEEESFEDPTYAIDQELYLSCQIDNTINTLMDGIKKKLRNSVTLFSPIMNKDREYTVTSTLTDRLPSHLQVHMERFFVTMDPQDQVRSLKIQRDVKFPVNLDVYELCDDSLKSKLDDMRKLVRNEGKKLDDPNAKFSKKCWKDGHINTPSQCLDPGSNGSGHYYLKAILSHCGRSSKSGHYISWVFHEDLDKWYCIDDDYVYEVKLPKILDLSGGYGDGDISYILFYSSQQFELPL